jgi:hypothetical protein
MTDKELRESLWEDLCEKADASVDDGVIPIYEVDFHEQLEYYATQYAREKIAAFMLRNSIATGHGDTADDLLTELERVLHDLALRNSDN